MILVDVEKNLICFEDLLLGTGSTTQSRAGATVTLTKINAGNLPYDETNTLSTKIDWLDSQYNYIVANLSSAFDHSTLIRKHLTTDYLIKADGSLFVPRIEETSSAAETTYAGKLWVKTISSTEAHLKRGSDLLAKFNPTSHAQILDINYSTVIATVAASFGTAATHDVGTTAGKVVALETGDKLPAVDGSQLTNLPTPVGVPVGGMLPYGAAAAPEHFLLCDGTAIDRTTYATLFAVIGTTYGVGNGTTTFQLPDMRGVFPRGLDSGRGLDTGRVLGSYQDDALQGHYHQNTTNTVSVGRSQSTSTGGVSTGNGNWKLSVYQLSGPQTDGTNGTPRVASETRGKNLAVTFIIRFE